MAFVVVLFRGEELTRRALDDGPIVIGRSPECDVSVRDILLSRRHCRIEPADGGNWVVEDLGSKNGTRIHGEVVTRAVLHDGSSIRMGKTQVKFYVGALLPNKNGNGLTKDANRRRPADPFEALSGTVSAFEYKPEHGERDLSRLPSPRPKPADPAAYADEDVYSLLTEIASSSWDSIYATASGPAAVAIDGQGKPRKRVAGANGATKSVAPRGEDDLPPRSRHVPADPSLQVFLPDPPPELPQELARPNVTHTAGTNPAPSRGWSNPFGPLLRQVRNLFTGRFARRVS